MRKWFSIILLTIYSVTSTGVTGWLHFCQHEQSIHLSFLHHQGETHASEEKTTGCHASSLGEQSSQHCCTASEAIEQSCCSNKKQSSEHAQEDCCVTARTDSKPGIVPFSEGIILAYSTNPVFETFLPAHSVQPKAPLEVEPLLKRLPIYLTACRLIWYG